MDDNAVRVLIVVHIEIGEFLFSCGHMTAMGFKFNIVLVDIIDVIRELVKVEFTITVVVHSPESIGSNTAKRKKISSSNGGIIFSQRAKNYPYSKLAIWLKTKQACIIYG